IKSAVHQDGNLKIQYPELTQMKDQNIEQQINSLLKEEVISFMNQYKDEDTNLEMKYHLMMQSSDTLSILYTGELYITDGMYPTQLLFTTNVNINNGERIRLSDRFTIDESFIDKVIHSPY